MRIQAKPNICVELVIILILVALSSGFNLARPVLGASSDAIAIRVMPNSASLSPARWYKENVKVKGSPQSLTVDGYQAVRDGRTVYVNAANIDSSDKFYTNIYIISYNQEAENATIDIFGQMLAYWKFNANITDADKKAKITRDTRRLADLSDIKLALSGYYEAHSGYPALLAGSYLAGKSISTWPSWRLTLGSAMAITLPVDPVNKLGACPAGYDAVTCWNQTDKKFADPTDDGVFNLPGGSLVYVYMVNNGAFSLCATMETNYITAAQGACQL
ncbi:MAG: hypothetical protein PHS62_01520 [Patescibacteria group bacterium]|nr:hypothetical protein [Patescibacteria group bacterium]